MSEIDTTSQEFQDAVKAALETEAGGLKSALKKERDARGEMEKQLRQFDGLDPAEIRKLLDEKKKAEDEKAKAAGDFEKLLNQEREKFAKELKSRDDKTAGLQKSLEEALIDAAARKAIGADGDADLLLPHVQKVTKLVETNGRYVAVVLDESGEPRLAPDAKTASDYMGIDHLVKGWKDEGKFAGAWFGTGASGGGAAPGKREGGAGARRKISLTEAASMSSEDIRKGGFEVVA